MKIETKKGQPLVLCKNFLMRKGKKSSDGLRQFWRCIHESSRCRGRAVSVIGSLVLEETASHNNHGASPIEAKKREALTMAKTRARENLLFNPRMILSSIKKGLSDDVIQSFPKDVNVLKLITNSRRPFGALDVDKPLHEMKLSNQFKSTAVGGRFLLHDSRLLDPDLPTFLIFASDRGLDFLRQYESWSVDGTFYCCPKYFAQLFTINVFKEESTLPAVFMLLPEKSEITYQRAFRALFQKVPNVRPKAIMSDFEIAPAKVLTQLFLVQSSLSASSILPEICLRTCRKKVLLVFTK